MREKNKFLGNLKPGQSRNRKKEREKENEQGRHTTNDASIMCSNGGVTSGVGNGIGGGGCGGGGGGGDGRDDDDDELHSVKT